MPESALNATRICLTPTRNEAWVIQRFAKAAKLWADHLIVADQGSTDGTPDQIRGLDGVQVVLNDSALFDELHRQRLLIEHARRIPGKRVLIALDADEALSANCLASKEWGSISEAAPGTVLRFRWVNILPGFENAWVPKDRTLFGFIDDGTAHTGQRIHNHRVPWPEGAPVLDLEDIVVLHFQYVAWDRMVSKQRWYQTWEYMNHLQGQPLQIFRQYSHMHGGWDETEIQPIRPEWLEGYARAGVDFRTLKSEEVTWWDKEVLQLLRQHGPKHFRKLAIWDKDWSALASTLGMNGVDVRDPRSVWERAAHRLLGSTQNRRADWDVRVLEAVLRKTGW
ncbi:MAG TPA: glycosyltransferase family 2 protein [Candidatus Acidoferrum sp.]|nr:glycosyltransferase family 2 protein [Candidatus Acidoferrum sp.]